MNDVKFILCISMFILFVLALICHNIEKNKMLKRIDVLEQKVSQYPHSHQQGMQ